MAEYYIVNDLLYGVKMSEKDDKDTLNTGFIRSERLRLNYTGSIVIAYDHEKRSKKAEIII